MSDKKLLLAFKKILAEKTLWIIKDWAGNYPFEKNPHKSAVDLGGGPVETWDSFDAAEEFLAEHLGEDYEEKMSDYEIEEIDPSIIESAMPMHLQDWLLKGFSFEELIDNVIHNEKIKDRTVIRKVFQEMIWHALTNAKSELQANMDRILKEVQERN